MPIEIAHDLLTIHGAKESSDLFGTKYKIGSGAKRYELPDQTFLEILTITKEGVETIESLYLAPQGQGYPGKIDWMTLKMSGKLQKRNESRLR